MKNFQKRKKPKPRISIEAVLIKLKHYPVTKEFISKTTLFVIPRPPIKNFEGMLDRGIQKVIELDARLRTPAYYLQGQASGMTNKDYICGFTNDRISKPKKEEKAIIKKGQK